MASHILDGTPADVVARYESLPALAAESDFGILDENVVVLDTETTGLSFINDELIQIAAARLEHGEITDWFVTFVNPGKFLTEEIINLTNIHEDELIGAPTPQEALTQLVEFVGDALVVAHNATFDRTFVTRHPEGYPLLENIWLDSLDLSRIALPRLKSHRLIDLVRTFDAPVSTHRADDDVAATCVVYRILLAAVASMPRELVRAIAALAPLEVWATGFAFRVMGEGWDSSGPGPGWDSSGPGRGWDSSGRRLSVPRVSAGTLSLRPELSHPGPGPELSQPGLSLRELRQQRIRELPSRVARRDADDLAGQLSYPTAQDVEGAFSSAGVLGAIYPDYEPRTEQRAMAEAIRTAFETSENLVVEAGTGVGKSMAYLVPSVLFARRNGVAVGIATKTNALLDQLVYQELPALAKALDQVDPAAGPLVWAPLKGMAHYPCLRKAQRLVDDGPGFREVAGAQVSQAPALAALLSYIEQSEFDDLDSLKIDYRALPRRLFTTTSHECLRRKCPFFGKLCFVHGARRRAEMADVVVTNHTLLFCDVAADGGLLPTVRHWVIDEAHAAEAEVRQAFAQVVDSEELSRIASRVSQAAGGRNVFARAERTLEQADADQLTLFFALTAKAKTAGEAFARIAGEHVARMKELLYFDPVKRTRRGQSYDMVDVWINAETRATRVFAGIAAGAGELIEASDKLIKAAQDLVAYLEGFEEAAIAQREIASLTLELKDIRNAAELIFQLAPGDFAYQATLNRKKDRFTDSACALLLDVGDRLNETFYARTHSVIYASATLSVGGRFTSFTNALGLNRTEFSRARTLQLDSSYDFDNNMIVYVVSDMPEPASPRYLDALNRLLVGVHRAQGGSVLSLFTNRREMEASYDEVSGQVSGDGLRIVCQKWGVSTKGLRDEFLADESLSLFALKSFWEGFDAPGDTLRAVVIPKLPFARPTDPLYCERASRDERAWWHYVLPQAVIETKQAAGRLIRKASDHGVLILADRRLMTKTYGKTFLSSLQSRTVRVCTTDEIVQALGLMNRAALNPSRGERGLGGEGADGGAGGSAR